MKRGLTIYVYVGVRICNDVISVYVLQLLDKMEVLMAEGGNIADYHCCELFPERYK